MTTPDHRDEFPLRGGRVTHGVFRVGDTVRRPPSSDLARRLLEHLAASGFDGAPIYLGIDERGRDVLAFIEGDVPPDLGFHDDSTLVHAARLIRRFHDLSATFIATSGAAAAAAEVVCHNDLSPCNFVFRNGVPIAMIDFDAAAPGSRAHDLGYAAWLWLDLGSPDIAPSEQRRRLAVFLDAYGTDDSQVVVSAALARQASLAEEGRRVGEDALARWAADCLEWTRQNEGLLV